VEEGTVEHSRGKVVLSGEKGARCLWEGGETFIGGGNVCFMCIQNEGFNLGNGKKTYRWCWEGEKLACG